MNDESYEDSAPFLAQAVAAGTMILLLWVLSSRISIVTGADFSETSILLASLLAFLSGVVSWDARRYPFAALPTGRLVASAILLALVAGTGAGSALWATLVSRGEPVTTWMMLDHLRIFPMLCIIPLAVTWALVGTPRDKGPGSRHVAALSLLLTGVAAIFAHATVWSWLGIAVAWAMLMVPVWRTWFSRETHPA